MPVTFRPSPETRTTRYWDTPAQDAHAILKTLRNSQAPQIDQLLAAPLIFQTGPAGTPVSGWNPSLRLCSQAKRTSKHDHQRL